MPVWTRTPYGERALRWEVRHGLVAEIYNDDGEISLWVSNGSIRNTIWLKDFLTEDEAVEFAEETLIKLQHNNFKKDN